MKDTFVQLGANTTLHFQGSAQGISPIAPNMLAPSLSNWEVAAGVISYNYTFDQQGLKSNVSCSYAETSPFSLAPLDHTNSSNLDVTYNVSCTDWGKTDALINVPALRSAWTNNTLLYWACQDETPAASYTIYLAGFNDYANTVGNVTCVINPIQSAIYSVMYRSTEGVFSAMAEANKSSPITFSTLITNALVGLAELISDSQNYDTNLFAQTIVDLGFQSFGPPTDLPPLHYLRMYEQMIQGILEYEVFPVKYFIPFLSLIVCHLTDDLPSVDIFNTSTQCPFLLLSHGNWATEIRGIWLVHDECQHRFSDSNNDHHSGRLGRSLSSYDHCERWWLCVSSFPTQTGRI